MKADIKFEKFYLIDFRGQNSRVVMKFVHIDSGREIRCNTSTALRILQVGEIQVQTKFATQKFIDRYARHKYRNLRHMKKGDPVNIYHIPVTEDPETGKYLIAFGPPKEALKG